jgi:hypothetical protein
MSKQKITKGSRVKGGATQYFMFRLGMGERMLCNHRVGGDMQQHMVHGDKGYSTDQPTMILQEAIRSDDRIGEARCEEHAKTDWNVTVDHENNCLQVKRP